MNAQRTADPKPPAGTKPATRKPWKKKTPVEAFFTQAEKLRETIAEKEEELKVLRRQLQKFEDARKIFEVA